MIKSINLGVREEAIKVLDVFMKEKPNPRYIKLINSNIKDLNHVIGKKVFKKDAFYINSRTLWEIMQPIGGKGAHHYHGLKPEEIYNALIKIKESKNVKPSYDNRFVVITDVIIKKDLYLAAILIPDQTIVGNKIIDNVTMVITIYPSDRKNLVYKK